jgi:hypothetical protein
MQGMPDGGIAHWLAIVLVVNGTGHYNSPLWFSSLYLDR